MRHALSFLLVNVVWTSVLAVEQQILKQGRDFELDEDFDKKVNAVLGKYHVPGLALAIVDDERTFAKVSGSARLTTWRVHAYPFSLSASLLPPIECLNYTGGDSPRLRSHLLSHCLIEC